MQLSYLTVLLESSFFKVEKWFTIGKLLTKIKVHTAGPAVTKRMLPFIINKSAICVESYVIGLHQICQHNRLEYYASIMLEY